MTPYYVVRITKLEVKYLCSLLQSLERSGVQIAIAPFFGGLFSFFEPSPDVSI
jgi:hypothetical protein